MLLFVLLLPSSATPIPHSAFRTPHSPKLVVVVANRLLLSDLDDPALPTIHKMLHEGAAALISPNCVGPKTEASVMLTANAGSPCRGGSYVKEFYNADELLPDGTSAGAAYTLRTGRSAPRGSMVFLGLGPAQREMAKLNTVPAHIGALGDTLRTAGMNASVTGNADIRPDTIDRSAAALVMDSRGIVDIGALCSNALRSNHAASPELRGTSVSLGRQRPRRTRESKGGPRVTAIPDLAVLYFGASTVLDQEKPSMSDSAYAARKKEMLSRFDHMLHCLLPARGFTVILVSFSPPSGTPWDQLTPVIIYPSRYARLLTSASTRTPGLLAASDFAPTVLRVLGVPASADMIGRAATVVPEAHAPEQLAEIGTRVTANQRTLTPIAVFLVALGALSFTPTALITAFGLKPSRRIVALLKLGLVAGSSTFGALLLAVLAPAGATGYITGTAVSMIVLTALCIGLAALLKRKANVRALPVVLVYGATTLIIVADALTGCNLCKWCGPSSYQITGMRFYGIGNEYAGVLISMAALAALFMYRRKWLTPVVGIALIIALGSGYLGANYGGTAAAVVTFVLLWLAVSRGRFGTRHVALAFGLAIAVVVAFALLDWTLAGSAGSHAARATGLTEKLGGGYLVDIAMRKVLFNLRITFSMQGLHYALAFVPFLAIWFLGVRNKATAAFKSDARIIAGMKAILIGAAAAFALNDSGIIFAGIMIAITVLVLLYSVLEEAGAEGPHPCPPHTGEGEVPCPES